MSTVRTNNGDRRNRIAGRDNGRPGYVVVDRPYRRWVWSDSVEAWDRDIDVMPLFQMEHRQARQTFQMEHPSNRSRVSYLRLILTVIVETAFLFAFLIALYLAIVLVAT